MTSELSADLARALGAQRSGDGWVARCPAHDDREPSLSITSGDNGTVLVHCHAGCTQLAVIDALRRRGLWPDHADRGALPESARRTGARAKANGGAKSMTSVFQYRDGGGRAVYEVVRKDRPDGSKSIYQRRINADGSKTPGMKGVERVPYRLPELISGIAAAERVFIAEGERKADLLARWGLVATCNSGGAGKWQASFSSFFAAGRVEVVILPDSDDPGRAHALKVAENLFPVAAGVKILELPGLRVGGDVVDWAEDGGSKEALVALVEAAPTWAPAPAAPEPGAQSARGHGQPAKTAGEQSSPRAGRVYIKDGPAAMLRLVDDAEVSVITSQRDKLLAEGRWVDFKVPILRVVKGELSELVDQVERALVNLDQGLFQRGGRLVRAHIDTVPAADQSKTTSYRLMDVEAAHVLELMNQAASFIKFHERSKKWRAADCPEKVALMYMARGGGWRLRTLAGVVTCPTMRRDGSLLDREGYDSATSLIFDGLGQHFPAIPEAPTRAAAEVALAVLLGLLEEFPFADKPSESVALSGILTAVARPAFDFAPLHAFDSPLPGSGKSFLVRLCSEIATGADAPVILPGKDEDETRKNFEAVRIAGGSLVSFDNLNRPLGGAWLAGALTEARASTRILGKSKTVSVPNTLTAFATSNNLIMRSEMVRRSLVGRIDAKRERPETRTFRRNPVEMVRERRGLYVASILTLLRAYIVAGKPNRPEPLNGFAEWSALIRGALLWLGRVDPVATQEPARIKAVEVSEAASVFEAWAAALGAAEDDGCQDKRAITIAELTHASAGNADLHDALVGVAPEKGGGISRRRLGIWMAKHADVIVGTLQLRRGRDARGGQPRWVLVKVAGATDDASDGFDH